jgi:hypothetical protein
MSKRFLVAWVVIFIAWMLGSYLVHGALLHSEYAQLPNVFRTEAEAQRHFPLMLLAHLILAGAFVWIYSRGVEETPWLGQGLRFGLAVALVSIVPTYMIYYVVQPIPGSMAVKQIIYDGILYLLLGALVAFMYRRTELRRRVVA